MIDSNSDHELLTCPLCGLPSTCTRPTEAAHSIVSCPLCGQFCLTESIESILPKVSGYVRRALSAASIESDRHSHTLFVSEYTLARVTAPYC